MNQLRRCVCGKLWQTHERGCSLWKCPFCGSTKKDHEIIKGQIFIHHRINPDEYTEILLETTWHETFSMLKGHFIKEKYCKNCSKYDNHLDYCNAKLLLIHNKKEFGNIICAKGVYNFKTLRK